MGISACTLSEVVVMPFNDAEAIEQIVKREKDNLVCVIVEPMMGAAGIIPARKGFLQDLRRITRENDVLLIFDVVQTLRHSWGGAQEMHGVLPDLTALAKIIGGGFPSGAVGGKADIMSVFDSRRRTGEGPPRGNLVPGQPASARIDRTYGRAHAHRVVRAAMADYDAHFGT